MVVASFVQHVQDTGIPIGEKTNLAQFSIKDTALLERLRTAINAGNKRVTAKLSMLIIPSKFSLGDKSGIINVDTSLDHNTPTLRNGVNINSLGHIYISAVKDYQKLKGVDSELVIPFGLGGAPGISDMQSFNITLNIGAKNTPLVFYNIHKRISAHFIISIYG